MEKNINNLQIQENICTGVTNGANGQEFVLRGDNGARLCFTGHIFSEGSFFDEDSGAMTRLKLFITTTRHLVYYVVSGAAHAKTRRFYELHVEDERCHMFDGCQSLTMPVEMLYVAVTGMCGITAGQAEDLRASLTESLSAATAC